MTNPQYPGNSNREKASDDAPDKKVERVVTSPVVRRKPSFGKRIREVFVPGDSQSVASYVVFDVIVPSTRELIADVFTQGIERMMFGESSPRRSRSRYSGPSSSSTGRVSYERYSSPSRPVHREEPRTLSRRARATHDFEEIVLKSRVEGEEVLDQLFMLLDKYKLATVADLYGMLGIDTVHTDSKYGWADIPNARVVQVRGGYLLDLPQPEPID